MFVECFSGLMGGGKSFYSVIRMARHIAKGGVVYSNIRLKLHAWFNEAFAEKMKSFWLNECLDGCRTEVHEGGLVLPVVRVNSQGEKEFEYNSRGFVYYLRVVFKWQYQEGQYHYIKDEDINGDLPELLPRGDQGQPVLVILDEALDHFETNTKGNGATTEFRSFLRHIRKVGINLVFIAQDFTELDSKIRKLVHFVWKFKDMATWPVPVFNKPLPPPWRDHVVCEKFHKIHFGKAKAESINKDTWVVRDPLVFGSYQSVAMHNAVIKMAEGVKTDFGDSGNLRKGKKKMNMFERAALFLCLLFSVMSVFTGGKVPESAQASTTLDQEVYLPKRVEPVEVAEVRKSSVVVEYGRFVYAESNGSIERLFVDGIEYAVGDLTPSGSVISVTSKLVHIMDSESGNQTFIYPSRGRPEVPEKDTTPAS